MLDDKLIEVAEDLLKKVEGKDWDEYADSKLAAFMYTNLVDFIGRCDLTDYVIDSVRSTAAEYNYGYDGLKIDLQHFKREKTTKNRLDLMVGIMLFAEEMD